MKKIFLSNCFLEAVKAKFSSKSVKIMFESPLSVYRRTGVFLPHWYWISDGRKYMFFASHRLKWWEFPLHRGFVRSVQIKDLK